MYSMKTGTHAKRTVQTDNVSEVLEKPLLHLSSSGLEIPLVSLKVFTVSGIDSRERVKGAELTALETYQKSKTGSPVLVYR